MAAVHDEDLLGEVLDGLEGFVRAEIVSRHEKLGDLLGDPRATYDERGVMVPEVVEVIREVRQASAEAGYFNLSVPVEMGGAGLGHRAYYEAWSRVYQVCSPKQWLSQFAISHWAFGPSAALEGLTPRARAEVLPSLISGRDIMCFGMSEPDAGSDAMAMTTTASPVSGGWRVNGRKIWTSHAPIADWMFLFAVTDPEAAKQRRGGISAFIVPMSADGMSVHSIIKMWDEVGGHEAETALDDVFVEDWQLIGELNRGFDAAMKGVSLGRIYNAARGYAIGKWALDLALDYAADRSTFGRPIAEHQAVMHPLAESAAHLHAAHAVAQTTTRRLDAGESVRKEVAMMKYLAIQAGFNAVDRAMQAHGAIGFSNELGLATAFRSMRSLRVADGTDEILLRTVTAQLLRGDRQL